MLLAVFITGSMCLSLHVIELLHQVVSPASGIALASEVGPITGETYQALTAGKDAGDDDVGVSTLALSGRARQWRMGSPALGRHGSSIQTQEPATTAAAAAGTRSPVPESLELRGLGKLNSGVPSSEAAADGVLRGSPRIGTAPNRSTQEQHVGIKPTAGSASPARKDALEGPASSLARSKDGNVPDWDRPSTAELEAIIHMQVGRMLRLALDFVDDDDDGTLRRRAHHPPQTREEEEVLWHGLFFWKRRT